MRKTLINITTSRLLIYISGLILLYHLILLAIGSYDMGFFDGPLRVLSKIYMTNGLIPYKDFGVVYPPGMFILFGKLIPYKSIIQTNIVLSFFYFALIVLTTRLLYKPARPSKFNYFNTSVFLLFNALVIRIFGASDTLSYLIPMIAVILIISYLIHKPRQSYLYGLIPLFAISVWFRWDWMLYLIIIQWLVLITALLFARFLPSKISTLNKHKIIKRQLILVTSSTVGYVLGATSLYLYLNHLGVLKEAIDFIIYKPIMLTKTYRSLPLPLPEFPIFLDFIIYSNILFLVLLIGVLSKKLFADYKSGKIDFRFVIPSLLLLGYILLFFPYALGRSDWPHFMAMWYAIGITWVLISTWFNILKLNEKVVIILALLPLSVWYIRYSNSLSPMYNRAEAIINREINDCGNAIEGITPKTIFVGRTSYENFLYNKASLYLLLPKVKPATAYITEEPGIHNSCKYGQIIVKDLSKAEKPMLAFLDLGSDPPENKATANMSSCGLIEDYLKNAEYLKIGTCKSYNDLFEIRLYPAAHAQIY